MDRQTAHDTLLMERLDRLTARWGWVLALGIILMIAGIFALGATVVATLATVTILGAILFIGGLVEVVSAFTAHGWRGFALMLLTGVLAAVVGFMFMANPAAAAGVVTLLLAAMLLVGGISRIVIALSDRFPSWGWVVASGVAGVILGVLVFAGYPTSALWFLGLAIGIELLFRGAAWISLSMTLRRASHRRREETRRPHREAEAGATA